MYALANKLSGSRYKFHLENDNLLLYCVFFFFLSKVTIESNGRITLRKTKLNQYKEFRYIVP